MAAISPLSSVSSPHSDPQIASENQNDGPATPNDAGIAVNGGEEREDEVVFADAPEAPVDDQNRVLVDKGASFVGFGEVGDESGKFTEASKGFDGEFTDAELSEAGFDKKDGILGDDESGDVEKNEKGEISADAESRVIESSSVVVGGSEKDGILGDVEEGNIENSAHSCGEENHVEDDGLAKIIDFVEEAVKHDVGDRKDETIAVETGAAVSSVFDDDGMIEKFEDAVSDDAVDAKKVEEETVAGEVKSDVVNDREVNQEGILQGDAIDATSGAGDDKKSDEVKTDVPIDRELEGDLQLEKDSSSSFDKAGVVLNDENISEEKNEISSVGTPMEESLLQEPACSRSFDDATVDAVKSPDNDENGAEVSTSVHTSETKLVEFDISANNVDKNEEQENSSAVVSEREKDDAGMSERCESLLVSSEVIDRKHLSENSAYVIDYSHNYTAAVGKECPDEFPVFENANVETNQAVVESETINGLGAPELATDVVEVVSVQDSQLASTHADDSESMHAEPSALVQSSIQASNSVTETEVKKATEISHNAGDDHNIHADKIGEQQDSPESNLAGGVSVSDTLEATDKRLKDIDGQIASDYEEEAETDEENSDKEMIDSDALVALLKAASSSAHDGTCNIPSQDGNRIFLADRPAGLAPSIPSLKPAPPRAARSNLSASEMVIPAVPDSDMTEEEKVLHEKVELIKVKFLRLVQRLGHSAEDTVAAQVLYRLSLAEGIHHGRQHNRAFSLENAKRKALQLEADGNEALDFSCNILVLGKSGVGKSATINSFFGKEKSHTNAFEPATNAIKEITGNVDGVKVRVMDTPGLRMSLMDQTSNRKVLLAIKKYTKNCPPDIVLYVDRMDIQTRDLNDLPLLKSITSILGPSIWYNAIVALTHAASAPPDGPSGSPLSYEVYVAQRSHIIQQSIRLAAGDMRLMNPVALVENHESCRKNRYGQKVLPNGLAWRPQMLLLCYSSKILSEANSLLKLQDPSPKKLFNFRFRSPPLPFLLSSLLQSKSHPKLTPEQGGEAVDSDIDLDFFSDSDKEDEEDEYDQLPPFKPLSKAQIAKLPKEQRKAYFDEFDYRVKLLQKKQWKDELKRMKEMKKGGEKVQDDFGFDQMAEDFEQDSAPATVPVPLPDMVLPPSFDCEAPTYRYRFLEPTSHLLARPVLDTHGWDHDCGYDGVSLEESLAIASRFPAVISAQVTKDKKDFSIHLESSVSAKHGNSGSSLAGFNVQAVGKQLAYTFLGETKFKNIKKNKTAGGFSVTLLGETVATGLKLGDELSIGKRVSLVSSAGAVRSQGDTAYGANLEAHLRDKEYPIGQSLTTLGLSLMKWHSDLALGANLQSQFSIGRNSKMSVRVGLNNKLTGQITVKTSSSEQLQLALVGIIPVALSIYGNIIGVMN